LLVICGRSVVFHWYCCVHSYALLSLEPFLALSMWNGHCTSFYQRLWYSNLVISFSPSVNVGWHYHWQVWLPPHRNEHLIYFFRWVKFFFQVIGHFLLYIYYTMHQNVDNKTNYIKKESFLSSAWEFVDIFNGQWLFWSRSNQWFYVQYVEYLSWSRINYDENCYEQTKCFLVNILHMFQITRVQCM
jgi:hypothetical protein